MLFADNQINDTIPPDGKRDFTIVFPHIPEERFITIDEILKGLKNRKSFYKNQPQNYSYHLYSKGMMNMTNTPESFLGFDTDTAYKGVFYLSESISEMFCKNPSKRKEHVLATRVSGNDRGVGLNFLYNQSINLYGNLIYFEGVTNRGIVSPLSVSAWFYYDFELTDAYAEDGKLIHIIKIIPKRKNDPVFSGYLHIVDSSRDIYSAHLSLKRYNGIGFYDSIHINLEYQNLATGHWMPEKQLFSFYASQLGYKMEGTFGHFYSDYVFHESLPDSLFKHESVWVFPEAIRQFYDYWDANRPEPLNSVEKADYQYKDSIYFLRRNKKFNDSIDVVHNKMEWYEIVFSGYTFWQSNKNLKLSFRSLIKIFHYNYVEGLVIEPAIFFRQSLKDDGLIINGMFNLATGREDFSTHWEIAQENWKVSAGRFAIDFNQNSPFDPYLNSLYTLITGEGFKKMFKKTFFSYQRKHDLNSKLTLNAGIEFAQRDRLENSVSFNFAGVEPGEISPNNPSDFLNYDDKDEKFYLMDRHESMTFDAHLIFNPDRVYARYPDNSLVSIGQDLPLITLSYKKGIPRIMNSLLNYDLITFKIENQNRLGLAGTLSWQLEAASFVNKKQMLFPDFHHFNTNGTILNGNKTDRFQLLNNYEFSTRHRYVLLHAEHQFKGFISNKIPLLRKNGIQFIAGINAMYLPYEDISYLEPFVSVDNILGIFRINYAMGFLNDANYAEGISIGVRWPFL